MPLRDAGIAYEPMAAIGLSTKKNTTSGMSKRISRSLMKRLGPLRSSDPGEK